MNIDYNSLLQSCLTSLILPVIAAIVTAKITSKREINKTYREKRAEVYEELLAVMNDFRATPSIVLDNTFYFRLLKLSNRTRVFSKKKVLRATEEFCEDCYNIFSKHQAELNQIQSSHMYLESVHQPNTEMAEEQPRLDISPGELDSLIESAKERNTPSSHEALTLVTPVLEAIKETEVP